MKAKFSFPFGRRILGNPYNFAGIIGGAALGMFVIYTPPLHVVFGGTSHLSPLYWLIPAAFGCLLLVWTSIRVVLLRKSVRNSRVQDIKGLMMCRFSYSLSVSKRANLYCIFSPNYANNEHAVKTLMFSVRANTLYIRLS